MARSDRTGDAGGPPRQLAVWCPNWPVVAMAAAGAGGAGGAGGIGPGIAAAVLRDHRVIAVSRAAAAEGVLPGVRRREAQARCPFIVLVDEDQARDARHFEPVVRQLREIVPLVEVTEPGTVVFSTRGPSRWCGGDLALVHRVHGLVRAALGDLAGLVEGIGVGIADGRFAASVAARRSVRSGAPVLVEPGRASTAASLAGLGVRSLHSVAGVSFELVDLLERLGVTTLGVLRGLPAPDVLARFGIEGEFAHRLAGGGDDRPPFAVSPPPELTVTQTFDDPVSLLGPLVFSAKQLAEDLHGRLAERGETCTRLLVEAESEHGERSERRWHRGTGLSAPAMVERVRWQLDGWVGQPGGITGGVVLLRLVPEEARADHGRQLGFWGEATQADEFAARAIARVTGLLGPDAVTVPEWKGGRHPGDRYHWVPATGADVADAAARQAALTPPDHPWPGTLAAPSPAWVAVEPVPIDILDGAGRRVGVDGRGAVSAAPATIWTGPDPSGSGSGGGHGGERPPVDIVGWAGPWPTDERWWDPARRRRRARFQVLTASGDALLVSLEGGSWWLEGRYD